MTVVDPEAIRREALASLVASDDPRTRDVLLNARIGVFADVVKWSGSAGHVRAHRVTLALDAHDLATLDAAPSVMDALTAALARATARFDGAALARVEPYWGLSRRVGGYRDSTVADANPDDPDALRAALQEYLRVLGEASLAREVAALHFETALAGRSRPRRTIVEARAELVRDPHARRVLQRVIAALLQRPGAAVAHVEIVRSA